MRIFVRYIFAILILFTSQQVISQIYTKHQSLSLTYSQLNENHNAATVFNILASNNEQNIYNIKINLSFYYTSQLIDKSNKLFMLNYRINRVKVSGDIKFRNFAIDTILTPDSLLVNLELNSGKNTIDSYMQKISTLHGSLFLEKLKNFTHSLYTPSFKIVKPVYSNGNIRLFVNTTNLINNYYGYSLLYTKILNYYNKLNSKNDNAPSEVYVLLMALHRLQYYVYKHNFIKTLNLKMFDPEGLIKKNEKTDRMLIRENTLTQQKFTEKVPYNDYNNFVENFIALSTKALSEAKKLQPYRAQSFKEFASIPTGKKEMSYLSHIKTYYNRDADCKNIMQLLFDGFVNKAFVKIEQKAYVDGLILIHDAATVYKNFNQVKRTARFINTYAQLYDGLMNSYLSVAINARKYGNNKMFVKYYLKAHKYFVKYLTDTAFSHLRIVFPEYRNGLLYLTGVSKNRPEEALKYATDALLANASIQNTTIDSAFIGIYRQQLSAKYLLIKRFISNNKFLQAKKNIDSIYNFINLHNRLTIFYRQQTKKFFDEAYPVYLEILQNGEIAYDNNNNSKAMKLLSAAANMENRYFHFHSKDLHQLLQKSFTPVAIKMLKNAELEIWANRPGKANDILNQIRNLQNQYFQNDNEIINSKIENLKQKIVYRKCKAFQYKLNNMAGKIESDIKRNHVNNAENDFRKLIEMQNVESRCQINRSKVQYIINKYQELFEFNKAYSALKHKIFSTGFNNALPDYVRLEKYYRKKNIARFNMDFITVYQFVKSQNSRQLTKKSLEYFISIQDYFEAFRYLDLLRIMKTGSAETRSFQRQLAKIYREQQVKPEKIVFKNEWYATFKNYYSGKIINRIPLFQFQKLTK